MSGSFVGTSHEITPWMSVFAGSLSGLIVRFVIAPIDIVKIRLQLHGDPQKYNSITSTIHSILKNEGLRAFWKGNVPAELMYVVYGGAQFTAFTTFSNITNKLRISFNINESKSEFDTTLQNIIVGALSGCTATCISYPLDLLRTRLASNDTKGFKSLVNEITHIYYQNGFRGFFSGSLIGVNYVALSTGLSFGTYSYLIECDRRGYFDSVKNHNFILTYTGGVTSLAGITAGVVSKTIVYPLDLAKRRLQMRWGTSTFEVLRTVIIKDGIFGIYRGLIPAVLKSAPATGISLACYEFFIGVFKRYNAKHLE
ncbi:mitochondrial thiamine pyrophosphate transporter [Pichia californica]|uniref:Mitochondrial thiamine pyrophosphate transporter n=1 Tax=Pichia californica TaxID=460514 RepID=A0A9P6WQS9_9ASCO|nr:mitochondrial thiamine pyrophosphate transporter [[Candida] californica]KAG0690667.1 mitochondrial thiamine pyrophosphate transporter [[Candida] californica]